MANKRDLVLEIVNKRSRSLRRAARFDEFSRRHDQILDISDFLVDKSSPRQLRPELVKYIPIAAVACLEGYFRMVVRDLIDYGEPYRSRCDKLEDAKFDLGTVVRLRTARITVGEFVAHLLKASSMADIRRHLDVLLGGVFLGELKATEFLDGSLGDVIGDLLTDLDEMFEKRHIFCHEIAVKDALSPNQAWSFATATDIFATAVETVVQKHIGIKTARVQGS